MAKKKKRAPIIKGESRKKDNEEGKKNPINKRVGT